MIPLVNGYIQKRIDFPFYVQAPKELVSECNLCGGKRLKLIAMTDRCSLEAPTVRCLDCGLMFLSLRMTAGAYREFYEGGHYRDLISKHIGRPLTVAKIESDQARYAESLLRFLRPNLLAGVRGGTLLDLGGATGVVAARVAFEFAMDATVVEPSQAEAEAAHNRGLNVENVHLEDYSPNGSRFNLVLLCRSVDHLLDIKAALKRIRQWVAPGGLFYVDFVSKGPIKIDHPFYLKLPTMTRYLECAGFKVKATDLAIDGRHIGMLAEGA